MTKTAGIGKVEGSRRTRSVAAVIAASGALAAVAQGQQFANPDFETGNLGGWTVAPTPNGVTLTQTVAPMDIDGPGGPLGTGLAAKFEVGQQTSTFAQQEGIELYQTLNLTAGAAYRVTANWAAIIQSNSENAEGGVFRLFHANTVLATGQAGGIVPSTPRYGYLVGDFVAQSSGPQRVGVRITRDYLVWAGNQLYQWVDNVTITPLVVGGCCLATGPCSIATQADCTAGGGVYRGDGSSCSGANCPAPTATHIVLPEGLTSAPGGAATNTLIQNDGRTYQFVYAASELRLNPGSTLTGINWRVSSYTSLPSWPEQDATFASYEITLSPSLHPPGSLSEIFANNIGAGAVTVRSGPLTIQANSFSGGEVAPAVNAWGPTIQFSTPYVYQGGDLLVTVRHSGNATEYGQYLDSIGQGDLVNGYGTLVQGYYNTWATAEDGWAASVPVSRFSFSWIPQGCYANCDASTSSPVLNVADFTCFLQRYASGDAYANCDGSTAAPALNVADFTCFLQKFAAGCP
jgi:hypothetical protein